MTQTVSVSFVESDSYLSIDPLSLSLFLPLSSLLPASISFYSFASPAL